MKRIDPIFSVDVMLYVTHVYALVQTLEGTSIDADNRRDWVANKSYT
jgi:hypothetical protein